jgi:hypothetical protein
MNIGQKFLAERNVTMEYEEINGAADYVQVCGFTDTYKVTLKNTDGTIVEILLDIDNMLKNVTHTKMLYKISAELAETAKANNFTAWCGTLSNYEADQLEDKKWSYLWRRYHYLLAVRHELEKVLVPGDMATLEEFWLDYVRMEYGSDPIQEGEIW